MYVSVCVCVSAVACVHTHPHQQAFSLLLWNTIVRANRKSSPGASCGLIQSNTSFPPHLCMSASVCVCVCVCVSGILRGSVSEFHREGCYKNIKQRQKTNTRRHGRERNVSTLTRQESEEIKAFFFFFFFAEVPGQQTAPPPPPPRSPHFWLSGFRHSGEGEVG